MERGSGLKSDDAFREPWAPVRSQCPYGHERKAASGDVWSLQGFLLIPGLKSQKEECRKVMVIFIYRERLKLH